jgi:hypothetical protein
VTARADHGDSTRAGGIPVAVIVAWLGGESADLVGAEGETAGVADRDAERETDVSIDANAGADAAGEAVVVTVLDRFVAAGVSRESFDVALAAGRIAVAGKRITAPATPVPPPTAVAIMLDAG